MNDLKLLLKKCEDVLEKNWTGSFTIPAGTLYPHQWSWDAAFIALGNSYGKTDKAIKEIRFLFDAQWKNGMVPHIVFNEREKTYFPAADFYEITRSENAPTHIGTSGMTQPPIHAISCYYIHKNSTDKRKTQEFLIEIVPKLMNFHRYLLTDRDPEGSGLVTILHPWESGEDDSPIWDKPLSNVTFAKSELPEFKRLDLIAVDGAADTIPSNDEYDKFIFMIEIMKKCNYDEKIMYEKMPFKIKDLLFSSILYIANKYLLKILDILENVDLDSKNKVKNDNLNVSDSRQHSTSSQYKDYKIEIKHWMARTERNYYRYFLPPNYSKMGKNELSLFLDYDLIAKDWIKTKTVSSLIPLATGLLLPDEAETMVKWLKHSYHCGPGKYCHEPALPSVGLKAEYFSPLTYWRGPVWINMNWLFWLGLLEYGYSKEADAIRNGVFELVQRHGVREYYDPYTGKGLGGKDFSWTAALVIDMIHNPKGFA
ncbi:MAG: hypothetical protein AB7V56_13905 [Candidatus Nitrosocosmicus sp.]